MPKLHIKGSLDGKTGVHIELLKIEEGCQTCFGTFDITIPYHLDTTEDVTVNVATKSMVVSKQTHRDIYVKG